jgi:hypothetical protein
MARERVLVNFFYAQPVGHAVEALHYCLGHHSADPSRSVSLALNASTAHELALLCPFIENVYPIDHPYEASDGHLVARRGRAVVGATPPGYVPRCRLRLDLPAATRASAARRLGAAGADDREAPWIALLPAGSSERALYSGRPASPSRAARGSARRRSPTTARTVRARRA